MISGDTMNTLNKKITKLFFHEEIRHDCYNEVRRVWAELQKNRKEYPLSLKHHILYAILRGKDWRKAFTPISNKVKLANGAGANTSLKNSLYQLQTHLNTFDDFSPLIDPKTCANLVRALLKERKDDAYNAECLEEIFQLNLSRQNESVE